jgi:hypothetical protein
MPTTTVDKRGLYTDSRSVFRDLKAAVYRYTYDATIVVGTLRGGVPSDPKIAEGWIRTKFRDKDSVIRELVAETMSARNGDEQTSRTPEAVDAAIAEVADTRCLNGFKRDASYLYIDGRQIKAMIKEAANIRWPKDRWGPSAKGTRSFFAEHVFVPQEKVLICDADGNPVTEPDGVAQDFVHARFGAAIKLAEYVDGVQLSFVVHADFDLDAERAKPGADPRSWGHLLVTGEEQGIGADRSQGFGTFKVVRWDRRD